MLTENACFSSPPPPSLPPFPFPFLHFCILHLHCQHLQLVEHASHTHTLIYINMFYSLQVCANFNFKLNAK